MGELNSLIRLRSLHGRTREELQVFNRYDLINKDSSRSGTGTPIRRRVDTVLDDIRGGKDLEMGMWGGKERMDIRYPSYLQRKICS